MCPLLYSEMRFLLPVRVENVIILVHGDSLAVKRDCSLKVASLTSWIALANFFKEQGFICLPSGSSAGIFLLKQKENVKWRRKGSKSHHIIHATKYHSRSCCMKSAYCRLHSDPICSLSLSEESMSSKLWASHGVIYSVPPSSWKHEINIQAPAGARVQLQLSQGRNYIWIPRNAELSGALLRRGSLGLLMQTLQWEWAAEQQPHTWHQ